MSQQPRKLNPTEIQEQAQAVAVHLHQAGVDFLPIANSQQVEAWSDRLDDPQAVTNPSVAETPPAAKNLPQPAAGVAKPSASDVPSPPSRTLSASGAITEAYPTALPLVQRETALTELSAEVAQCTRCEVLSSCRTKTVFGEGSSQARFAFFGEGPGADEDKTGRPFVGRAGELLTKMIGACTLDRKEVFIFNTVKCRPPGNRNPEPDELAHCRSFYQSQLQLIQPEYIVCLGAVAAKELLQSNSSVGRLRGKFHQYRGSKVIVTYHPAYLLRNESAKKAAWADLKMLMSDAGIQR